MWWQTPVISILGWLREEAMEFETSPGYIEKPCFKRKKKIHKLG
jgi:hypothetical protein